MKNVKIMALVVLTAMGSLHAQPVAQLRAVAASATLQPKVAAAKKSDCNKGIPGNLKLVAAAIAGAVAVPVVCMGSQIVADIYAHPELLGYIAITLLSIPGEIHKALMG